MTRAKPLLDRMALWLVVAIMVLAPFHAVFTTWAGSNFGYLDIWRLWKELLLIPLTAWAVWRLTSRHLWTRVINSPLSWLVLAYGGLTIGLGLLAWAQDRVNLAALGYSLVVNLRLVWFMWLVWVVSVGNSWLGQHWRQVVLVPAIIVIGFGLMQHFVLPADWLRHLGYGPDTIPAIQTVDQKLEYRRLQSTLRGANPLGAYLVLVMTIWLAGLAKRSWRQYATVGLVAGGLVLFFSYSRSAWLGLVVAGLVWGWLKLPRRWFVPVAGVVLAMGIFGLGLVWQFRHNDVVQNSLFHADEHSQSAFSSNQSRGQAMLAAWDDLRTEPLGRGPGTAGPASARNHSSARIAENYFLQLGQEVGWLGLGLFISINGWLAVLFWRQRQATLPQVLLAVLAGLTVVNLVSHAWTDDTLAIIYWGLAGLFLAQSATISNSNNGKKSKKIPTSATLA